MSTSPARRQRLATARRLPQDRCPRCGADLSLVFSVSKHLVRCAAERLLNAVSLGEPGPRTAQGGVASSTPPLPH